MTDIETQTNDFHDVAQQKSSQLQSQINSTSVLEKKEIEFQKTKLNVNLYNQLRSNMKTMHVESKNPYNVYRESIALLILSCTGMNYNNLRYVKVNPVRNLIEQNFLEVESRSNGEDSFKSKHTLVLSSYGVTNFLACKNQWNYLYEKKKKHALEKNKNVNDLFLFTHETNLTQPLSRAYWNFKLNKLLKKFLPDENITTNDFNSSNSDFSCNWWTKESYNLYFIQQSFLIKQKNLKHQQYIFQNLQKTSSLYYFVKTKQN
eukprot:TRINITY_DN1807_c0_g1_i6.p3 TRINITY_DN1807_c0_g1~~TRINITY_DN1807_c0_g1_i6.p3  ORF type:complete len:261 (+),score=-2.07 TRINITY_DN1807_c0_g1_i6:850-1632(+)